MVDAIVGGVIMVVATTSLFLAIEVAEKAMNSAGRYCLTEDEKNILDSAGLSIAAPSADLDNFWNNGIKESETYLDGNGLPARSALSADQCQH